MANLAAFVAGLRARKPGGIIPDFDPWDGGVNAELLYLLEAPGPRAGRSGFISRNNPDESAKNFFELNEMACIPRKQTISWNVVPWYIGSGAKIRPATAADVAEGREALLELLGLLPRLRAVVFVGRKAELAMQHIQSALPSLTCFRCPHPSPMYCNMAPGNKENILSALRQVAAFLRAGNEPALDSSTLDSIQRHFHALIRERAGDLVGEQELELPDLSRIVGTAASKDTKAWFAVPGMYGGFAYWFEEEGKAAKLITESWSRVVGGSGQRHEITADGSTLLDQGFV